MIKYTTIIIFSFFCISAFFLPAISAKENSNIKSLNHSYFPVIIPGKYLKHLSGARIDMIRVGSFKAGVFTSIPFQIDQRDSNNNWVWDVALKGGKTFDDQDPMGEKLIDDNDLLLFMSKDIGSRMNKTQNIIEGQIILEVEVVEPGSKTKGWAYITYHPSSPSPPLTKLHYMRYNKKEQKITSPIYELTYSKKHIAVIDDLTMNDMHILDRLKMRGFAEINLGLFSPEMKFNEEDISGYLEGYINGPVRILRRSINTVKLPFGFRTSKIKCDHYFYPDFFKIPLILSIRFLVHRSRMLLSADYKDYPFNMAYFPGNKEPILFGTDKKGTQEIYTGQVGNWMALSGFMGSVVSLLIPPEDIKKYSSTSLYLMDSPNKSNKPESYPGSKPEAGFIFRTKPGIPKGNYTLYLIMALSKNPFTPGQEKKTFNIFDQKPTYEIKKM